jgi:signal transduction histidine kinase
VPPASVLFATLLVVVAVALLGGARPALTAVAVGLLAQEILYSFPYGSLADHKPAQLSVLIEFVVVGVVVGILVDALNRLTAEQAALRRVAMLVATEAPTDQLFTAVTEEVGQLLPADFAGMNRYEPDGTMIVAAAWSRVGDRFPVGARLGLEGESVSALVARTGRPARIDSFDESTGSGAVVAHELGVRSAVATPITVQGRLWGTMIAASKLEEPLPADTETRLASFTELLATAIANAESRAGLARLAEEQAALRRVATLVARAAPSDELFAAVTEEVGRLLPVEMASMARYESDDTVTVIATWGGRGDQFSVGTRLDLEGENLSTVVAQAGRSAGIDSSPDTSCQIGAHFREAGIRSAVATPILVEDRLWGMMIAGSIREQPLPADTEARLANFTDLLATAIGNAETRAELAASRVRIVVAADETRRRIERDLHDGAQQWLVSLGLELRAVQALVPPRLGELQAELSDVADGLGGVLQELREIARGIHPAILAEGGLGPALKTLARRCPVPVELEVHAERRLPERVEVATYFVVSEALTNAAKHAHAAVIHVDVEAVERAVRVDVRDDGDGGADRRRGSGLVGLADRVEALGGTITVRSPVGAGTSVQVELPLDN